MQTVRYNRSQQDKMRSIISILLVLLSINCSPSEKAADKFSFYQFLKINDRFDCWVHNGLVHDGLGHPAVKADVLISGDKIVYVGWVDSTKIKVKQKIDATGKVITPGFIDTHAHGDPLATPEFSNFLAMGVTTIVLGQDGGSPANDIGTWLHSVDSIGPAVNIATLAGHGSLRRQSGIEYKPDPTDEELDSMVFLLKKSMLEGAWGLSTGLEYTPGIYASDRELLLLARAVGEQGGLIMSHIRNEDDSEIENALAELLRQGQYCKVHVSHLKVVYGKGQARADTILSFLRKAENSKFRITADVYPYMASYTGIGIVFPPWAKAPHDYNRVKQNRRQELLEFLRTKVTQRNGPEATLLGTGPYAGKTLSDLSKEQNRPFEEILLDIGPEGASGAYFVMDEALQSRLLTDSLVMVCSDGSPTMLHPRGYGSFAKIIEQYVSKDSLFALEEAVRKMTALPAATLGLKERGVLASGYLADLLIFDPQQVKANATFTTPHLLSSGFDYVLVNGKIAIQAGEIQKNRNGRVLLR